MLNFWKSVHPHNEYAPTWNIPFWNSIYPNPAEIDVIRQWLIDNEQNIIDKFKNDQDGDGGTGLGENSLTGQYMSYNLFEITKDVPEFQNLLNWIKDQYALMMQTNSTTIRNLNLFSWANVVRKGQKIDKHGHGGRNYSYLSGNLHLDNYQTKTLYFSPVDENVKMGIDNVKGGLTMFPSYILHSVSEHQEDTKRVSIAFDLFDFTFTPTEDLDKAIEIRYT